MNNTSVAHSSKRDIQILVSDEDKMGNDIMKMSDFFSVALQGMANEIVSNQNYMQVNYLPIADISMLNEALRTVGFFRAPEFDLIPDFASLPKEIKEGYENGKYILGESKQVDGNLRAVLVDAETKVRVKDVTFKQVEKTDITSEISQNMLMQMQLRQISDKLKLLESEQSYLIDFTRNQAIIRPFLDARDDIRTAQQRVDEEKQREYLKLATQKLQSAINAIYVDINTIEGYLSEEAKKKWFLRLSRGNIDKQIARFTKDLQIVTKYVGLQMQVCHYLGDTERAKDVLCSYQGVINRLFIKGVVSPDKSVALLIHENIDYDKNNLDCWYNMEAEIKPMIEKTLERIESKELYIVTMEDRENE